MAAADAGTEIGLILLDHPDHELYDEALPGEIQSIERFLKLRLPPSYRALLEVGSGGILASGDLLLGTKDPAGIDATLHQVARAAWEEGLDPALLPILDGEAALFCLDLGQTDEDGENPVVEVDLETLEPRRRWADFPAFAREILLAPARDGGEQA